MMAVLSKTRTSLPPGRPFSNLIKHEERAMTFIQKKKKKKQFNRKAIRERQGQSVQG